MAYANLTAPAAGSALPVDTISATNFPRTKIAFGAEGSATDVSSGDPLPVTGTFWQATQPVSLAAVPLATGAATSAKQDTLAGLVSTEATLSALSAKLPASLGAKAASGSLSIVPATSAVFSVAVAQDEYETVAASQTDQTLGATGAIGDYLAGLLIIPATTSPGAVSIKDGAGSAITIFTGGASSVTNLVPFFVPLGAKATGAGWKVTTGANVSAIGVGDFT